MGKKEKKSFRSGMVSIVGRPNVGKSTLLNQILGEKVSIVSRIPQTTRHQIRGIHNDARGQIVFIDTPGLHLGKDKLDQFMNQSSASTVDDVDCVIYLVDTSRRIGEEEDRVARQLKSIKTPIILGFNKVDLKAPNLEIYIKHWEKIKGMPVTEMKDFQMIALSGEKKINIDKLLDIIFDVLPEGEALYPLDVLTDFPQRMAVADMIREKFLNIMREEVPHAIGVIIEKMEMTKKKILYISALILVERDTQKEIVIGKKGANMKIVGELARKEIEEMLSKKVFLEMLVRTEDNWRNNVEILQQQGYQFK